MYICTRGRDMDGGWHPTTCPISMNRGRDIEWG